MRFLQINTFYPAYLRDFYAARPHLSAATFAAQIDALLDDGFSGSHIFTRALRAYGDETMQVIANDPVSQGTWLKENGYPVGNPVNCADATVRQIEQFAPDVVYTTDVIALGTPFFKTLKKRPPLVAGWRGFPIPRGLDLSGYDLILTSFDRIFDEAKACGVRAVERFHPGFPEDSPVLNEKPDVKWDVIFSGTVTREHMHRVALVNMLAEMSRDPLTKFSFGIFMADASALSPLAQSLNQGARWGSDMLRLLRSGKIVVNIDVDAFGGQPPNMRLIEATGAGAFLITSSHPELARFFEPAEEVETFRTPQELAAKILFYLGASDARTAIARAGQERCLRDHGLRQRTPWFRDIMMRALAAT